MSDPTVPSGPEDPQATPPQQPEPTPPPPTPPQAAPTTPPPAQPNPPAAPTQQYPPAGTQQYPQQPPPPGYAPPAAPVKPRDSRPKTIAIIAVALAGVGFILAFIPFVTFVSGLFLLAGFIMGIIGLVSKKQGGKAFSIAAVAASVVGWIVSVFAILATLAIIGQAATTAVEDSGSSLTDPPAQEETEIVGDDLQIVESAFGPDSFDPTMWWYVVIIDNPNSDLVFDSAELDIEALSADGVILDSSTDFVTLLSGETAVAGTFFEIGQGQIDHLEVTGPSLDEAVIAPAGETGSFSFEELSGTGDEYSTTVSGVVTSDFDQDQELVSVVVIIRAGDGTIIGANSTYVDRVPAGGAAQFEVLFFEQFPADATFEAYAAP